MIRAVIRRPSLIVCGAALAVCVPAGPGGGTAGKAVEVHAADLAAALLVAVAMVAALSGAAPVPRRAVLAVAPVAAAAGIAALCSLDAASSVAGFVRVLELFVLVPLAVVVLVRERRDAMLVAGAVVAVGLFQGLYGIWQAQTGNGAAIGGETVRAVGTFGAGDVMALSIVAGFGVVITLSFVVAGPRRLRPYAVGALVVLGLAVVLALSRGSWIAISAATALVLVLYSRTVALKTFVTAAALLVVAVGGLGMGPGSDTLAARAGSLTRIPDAPDQSVVDRYSLWTAAEGMWRDHPVTGVGVRNFPAYRDTYAPIELSSAGEVADTDSYRRQPLLSPHNQYMLFVAEQGVVGLLGLLTMFGVLLHGVFTRLCPRDPLWLASAGFLVGLLINFLYADISGPSSVLVAIMIGLAAAGPAFWERGDPARSGAA
jgi:O-antigen ligase